MSVGPLKKKNKTKQDFEVPLKEIKDHWLLPDEKQGFSNTTDTGISVNLF